MATPAPSWVTGSFGQIPMPGMSMSQLDLSTKPGQYNWWAGSSNVPTAMPGLNFSQNPNFQFPGTAGPGFAQPQAVAPAIKQTSQQSQTALGIQQQINKLTGVPKSAAQATPFGTMSVPQGPTFDQFLQNLGQSLPGLAAVNQYYNQTLSQGLPNSLLDEYRQNFRTSIQSAGWGEYAASPDMPAQEAAYVTKIQEQAKQQLAPQVASFNTSLFSLYQGQQSQFQQAYQFQQQFQLQQQQFEAELAAANQQSDFAKKMYQDYQSQIDQFNQQNKVKAGQDLMRQQAAYAQIYNPFNPYTYKLPSPPGTFGVLNEGANILSPEAISRYA